MQIRLNTGAVHHWWIQRATAVVLIPLIVWFLYIFFHCLQNSIVLLDIVLSPPKVIAFFVFLFAAFYHAVLGMQVICEDYIQSSSLKMLVMTVVKLLSLITFVGCAFSAIYFAYQVVN